MTLKLYVDPHPALPDDEELMLITAYVCRSMTRKEMEAFEKRLDEDEAFFDRVEPILDAWVEPGVTRAEMEALEEMRTEGLLEPKSGGNARRSYSLYGGVAAAAAVMLAALTQLPVIQGPMAAPAISTVTAPGHVATAKPSAQPTSKGIHRPAAPKSAELPARVQIKASEEPGVLPALATDLATSTSRSGQNDFVVIGAPVLPAAPLADPSQVRTVTNESVQSPPTVDGFWGRLKARVGGIFGRSKVPQTGRTRPTIGRVHP